MGEREGNGTHDTVLGERDERDPECDTAQTLTGSLMIDWAAQR